MLLRALALVVTVPWVVAHAQPRGGEAPAGVEVVLASPTLAQLQAPTQDARVDLHVRTTCAPGDRVVSIRLERNGMPVMRLPLGDGIPIGAADGHGGFHLRDVDLRIGANAFELTVITVAGAASCVTFDIARHRADPAIDSLAFAGKTATLGGDHLVSRELTIPAGHTLRLRAGCVLRFAPDAGLVCHGRLEAHGTGADPVWLLPADTVAGWRNVLVTGAHASARLAHTHIRYAGGRGNDWIDNRTVARTTASHPEPDPDTGTDGGGLMVLSASTDTPTVLEYCTLLGCQARAEAGGQGFGGAAMVERGRVQFTECRFLDCRADVDGGALYVFEGGDVSLTGCQFARNVAGRDGGAVTLLMNTAAVFDDVEVIDNSAGRNGGAINVNLNGTASLVNCLLAGNVAGKTGAGLLLLRNERAVVERCWFEHNRARYEGGGCYISEGASARLGDCRFTGNRAGTTGGGLTILNCAPQLDGCRVTANEAGQQEGAGGVAIRYGRLASGERYAGDRLTREALQQGNDIRANRPYDLVLDAAD